MHRTAVDEDHAVSGAAKAPSGAELLDRLRACVAEPAYAARVAAADVEGRMDLENMRLLRELGVTALPISGTYGAAPVALMVEVMEVLGSHDASAAVAVNMHWAGARGLARMPSFPRRDEALAAIVAGSATVCGAFSNPAAELDSRRARLSCQLEGDVVVFNGRAGFGSMSDAASYAVLGGVIEGSNAEEPTMVMTLGRFGEEGLIRHDNWSAMGMRSTGSNDIECRGHRIPIAECLVMPLSEVRQGRRRDSAIVAFGVAGIWLGLAQAAFDFTVDHVQHRYGYMAEGAFNPTSPGYRADEAWAQVALGNMDHWLGTGRALLGSMVARLDADEDVPPRELVRVLFHLRRMSEEVSMGVMKVCGAHGYVTSRPLERLFRDLVGGIVMAWKTDQLQQTLGVAALGREIAFTGPAGS
jgi:alkylation response protein AidB-like acyl-CoA dehydrogenase